MIFSSNRKSVNYSKNPNRTIDNAKWNTITDIDVNIGDQLSIYNAVLNLRGSSSDNTIEILDVDQPSGLTDGTCGIEFTPYINDNARDNTIALPYTGFTNKLVFNLYYPTTDIRYPFLDPLTDNALVVPQAYVTNPSDKIAPYNGNEMNCTNMYNFSYDYQSSGDQVCNPRYIRTLYTQPATQTSISCGRYIVLYDYLGPHKKEDGTFWSDGCNEKKLFVKINIGESYSAPQVIANQINDSLHDTNDFNNNNLNPIVYDYLNRPLELPSITGSLLYNKVVNGADATNDATDGGRSRLYGNIAVKNLADWKALHILNRVSLSFEGNIGFNEGGNDLYTLNRPSFIMPRGYMTNNDNDSKNIDCAWYPRVRKELQYKTAYWITPSSAPSELESHTENYYYSCLPENFMIITNIEYNEANIKMLSQYKNYKEKLEGNDINNINNYRMHFDIGESQHGFNSTQRSEYLFYTSQGSLNLIQNNDWKNPPDFTKYAYSYPYVPFKEHLQAQNYNEFASNRSDIPGIGYMQCVSEINIILATLSYIAVIAEIDQDVPHRFKDNKEKNASIAFKSRYIENWRELMKFDNLDGAENLEDLPEGCGMYDTSYFDPNTQDDTLSKQYNIGVYPIDMHANKNPIVLYELSNTYWICDGIENNNILKFTIPYNGFLLKIVAAVDQDHQTYGGYSIYEFLDNPAGWFNQSDYYIYCHQNQTVKAGRNSLDNVTYNNGLKIDMTTHGNIFVIDAGNTKRWIISVDTDHFDVYPMDGYSDDAGQDYDDLNNYNILGGEPYPNGSGGYIEVKATSYHIISTNPDSRYYVGSRYGVNIGANGNNPVSIPQADNPSHVVCGFLLYRDSATRHGTEWTISSDYALPSLYQGIQALSMSFMDHEAVWLVNEEMWGSESDIEKQNKSNTINYLSIGANNPTFTFEDSLSRFAFSYLHNPLYLGLEDMPKETNNDIVSYDTSNLGQLVMKFNDDKIKRNWLFKLFDGFRAEEGNPNTAWFTGFGPYDINYNMTYSDGGLFITGLYGEEQGTNATTADQMTPYNADNFDGLLYKLGFIYSDLISDDNNNGNQSALFVYGKETNINPLTTNPSLDITNGLNFSVQDYTEPNSAGVGEPLYNRGIGSLQPVNIQATTSEFLYASNIPEKNNDGFYLIYCNLSKSNYIDGECTYSIIGNVMKNYVTGDYIYAFQQPSFVFDYPFKITDIQIEIRNANGDLVALNDDNSVIFQLIRNQMIINNKK